MFGLLTALREIRDELHTANDLDAAWQQREEDLRLKREREHERECEKLHEEREQRYLRDEQFQLRMRDIALKTARLLREEQVETQRQMDEQHTRRRFALEGKGFLSKEEREELLQRAEDFNQEQRRRIEEDLLNGGASKPDRPEVSGA